MAITRVAGQQASVSISTATTGNVVLPNNPTTGNLVVIGLVEAAVTATSAQDASGNSYVRTTGSPTAAGQEVPVSIWYLQNAPANANKTITITYAAASTFQIWAAEYAGAVTSSVLERDIAHTSATNQTAVNDPTITTTNDGDLLFGICATGGTLTVISPWTGVATTQVGEWSEDYIQPTQGAQAMGFTAAVATTWTSLIAAFISAAGGAPATPSNRSNILLGQIWM